MPEPLFSVLITAYNAEEWIDECLRSVVRQDCRDFECLVSDDASTDRTAEIIRKYAASDSRIIPFVHTENKGGGVRIFELLRKATGQICVELGGDDFLMNPSALSRIRSEYDRFPGLDCTAGSFVMHPIGGVMAINPGTYWWKAWSFCKPLTFRRELGMAAADQFWAEIIDPETKEAPRYGWDVALYFPIRYLAKRYRTIYDVTYVYRKHSHNDQNEHRADQLATQRRMEDAIDELMKPSFPAWWENSAFKIKPVSPES